MRIHGIDGKPSAKAIDLEKLQMKKLNEDFEILSRQAFIKKWVEFDFIGDSCQNLSWEIITDYFVIHRNGYIKDSRDFVEQLKDNYDGKGYSYPQGVVIGMKFNLLSKNDFITKLFGKGKTLTMTIDLRKITRIKGSLSNLELHTENLIIKLSDTVEIICN